MLLEKNIIEQKRSIINIHDIIKSTIKDNKLNIHKDLKVKTLTVCSKKFLFSLNDEPMFGFNHSMKQLHDKSVTLTLEEYNNFLKTGKIQHFSKATASTTEMNHWLWSFTMFEETKHLWHSSYHKLKPDFITETI